MGTGFTGKYASNKSSVKHFVTVLPRVKRHAGIGEGEHILRNVFMLSTGIDKN